MDIKAIDHKANQILATLSNLVLPVKVEELVRAQGLTIMPYPLEDDVSGILVIENGKAVIGYNRSESRVRRRFTIAHEFGHYTLHKDISTLFVDKMFRASKEHPAYNSQTVKYEQEANVFAAALLMPESLVRKEAATVSVDLGSEIGMKQLAKKFDVSSAAMYFRLFNLHLI